MRNTLKKMSQYFPSPWGRARVGVLFLLLPFTFNAQTNTFPASGNVGIGVASPVEKLDVRGTARFARLSGGSNYLKVNSEADGTFITSDDPGTNQKNMFIRVSPTGDDKTDKHLYFQTGKTATGSFISRMVIRGDGKVGIGTTFPDTKLAVNGVVHSKEVKVDLNGWSDFVFEEHYNLPTLEEVEQHIKEKGHLKDIPSAKEVEANGIFLGEMDAKLLQKIEELTLYTLQQQKEIEALRQEIKKLQEKQ
ncbi:hypothetical protein [Sinomicrobium sp. M5D2P17]